MKLHTSTPPCILAKVPTIKDYFIDTGIYSVTITDAVGCIMIDSTIIGTIFGCTDPLALNYDVNDTYFFFNNSWVSA